MAKALDRTLSAKFDRHTYPYSVSHILVAKENQDVDIQLIR